MCVNCSLQYAVEMVASGAIEQRFEELARRFYGYDGWDERSMDLEAIDLIGKELAKGVEFGFDSSLGDLTPDSHRFRLLQQMNRNVYVFSGFKSYQQLREMSSLIYDSNGLLRPFNEFLKDVRKVNATYNVHYLNAEYNHAVASSQMAVNWQGYMENIDVAPWLKYQTAGDERVREEHRGLDGATKRKDDPFWKTWYPPNGWNCRCDVVELVDAPEGEIDPEFLPENQPSMFKGNVGTDGVLFPDTHPYFDAPKPNGVAINRAADQVIPAIWGNSESNKDKKRLVLDYARKHLVGKTYDFEQISKPASITWQGLQHAVNYKSPFVDQKLKAISELDVIMARAKYSHQEAGRSDGVMKVHKLKSYYMDYDVEVIVRETFTTSLYDLTLVKRKTTKQ